MTYFSQNLEFLMKNKHITQTELANKLGKSKQVVNLYIKGTSFPTFEGFLIIAKVLNIGLDDLVYTDLNKAQYSIINEPEEKYLTSPIKRLNCYLTGDQCFFRFKEELEKENERLRARLSELEGKHKIY